MKRTATPTYPIIAFAIAGNDPNPTSPKKTGDDDDVPHPDEIDKFPEEGEEVENLPPLQPDVDPLKRENPDVEELDENEPLDSDDDDLEQVSDIQENEPTGQTIVVDRRTGKDEL